MARRTTPRSKAGRSADASGSHRPTPQDILDFLAANPDQSGKREVARAFGLKGADRAWLKDLLREMAAQWPFFSTRMDMLEMVFAKADSRIAAYYDECLVPAELRPIGEALRQQLASDTATVLEVGGKQQLLAAEPWIAESLRLRDIYTEPLNMLQAELLRRSREAPEAVLERAIMVTIAGVAAGMRNTG